MSTTASDPFPSSSQLARVVSVQDPEAQARVQVLPLSGSGGTQPEIWARLASPFGGPNSGATFSPQVGDEVLITFVGGNARLPVVLGGLWNGSKPPPPTKASSPRVEQPTLTSKAGTKISIVEGAAGAETIVLETNHGVKSTFATHPGGAVSLSDAAGNAVTLNPAGITLKSSGKLSLTAAQVEITAGTLAINAAQAQYSGLLKCDVLQANSVIASSYTPGTGNIL